MRYILAVITFFGLVFAACKHQAEVRCDTKEVIAQQGDTYYGIAANHCSNLQEAEFRLLEINQYPAGAIPVGAVILLP